MSEDQDAALGAALAPDLEATYDATTLSLQSLPLEASAAAPKKKTGFSRKPWTKQEDEMLKELVNRFGPKRWATIASQLPDRIGKQCRERWTNHLRPEISKEPWRPEEDVLIFYYQKLLGNQWAEIAKYLPGRTENAIKNRFHSSLRRFQRQEKRKFGQQAVLRAMFARQGMSIPGLPGMLPPHSQLALAMEMQKKAKKPGKADGKDDAEDGEPSAKRARMDEAKEDALVGAPNPMLALGGVDPNSVSQMLGNFDPTFLAAQQALLANSAARAPGPAHDVAAAMKDVSVPPPANADVLRAALVQAASGGNPEVFSKLLGMQTMPNLPTIDPAVFSSLHAQVSEAGGKPE